MDFAVLDINLFYYINHGLSNPVFDILMPAITSKGYLLMLPHAVYMLLEARKKHYEGRNTYLRAALWTIAVAVIAFGIADWAGNNLKHFVGRARPCKALEGVRLLVGCTGSGSMPSNHAINSFAYAVPVFYLTKEYLRLSWRIFPLALAALVAFSRVYIGVHYPADVAAGAAMGTMIASMAAFIYKKTAGHTPRF